MSIAFVTNTQLGLELDGAFMDFLCLAWIVMHRRMTLPLR